MKSFTLKGQLSTGRVWLNGEELRPWDSQQVVNHSPDGFMWGYGGSGPAQLALAVCLKIFPKEVALREYQNFKWQHIAKLPQSDFEQEILVVHGETKQVNGKY